MKIYFICVNKNSLKIYEIHFKIQKCVKNCEKKAKNMEKHKEISKKSIF